MRVLTFNVPDPAPAARTKKREKIKKEEEGIKKLEKEIENLKTLEIKGLINEVDIPYEELVKMIKELKN